MVNHGAAAVGGSPETTKVAITWLSPPTLASGSVLSSSESVGSSSTARSCMCRQGASSYIPTLNASVTSMKNVSESIRVGPLKADAA